MKSCCCGFIFISQINLFVSWQLNDIKSELRDFEIIANLTRFESWFSCSLYKNQLLIFKCALKKHTFSLILVRIMALSFWTQKNTHLM